MISQDISWEIGGITADALVDETKPTLTRGEEITATFFIEGNHEGQEVTIGHRYATGEDRESGSRYATPTDARLGQRYSTLSKSQQRHDRIRQYLDYSGEAAVTTGTNYRGEPWYREDIPPAAPVDSFIVEVQPGQDIPGARVWWGVIVGGDDRSRPVHDLIRIELDIVVLATRREYSTRSELETALGTGAL